MPTITEYALLAGASYYDTRTAVNRFPLPQNWSVYSRVPQDGLTGFEAATFRNGNDIVISFAGTYPTSAGDQAANLGLATGYGSAQLLQAAEYYLQVKAANFGANITLTGHSLGGGLAALVGVFFGVQAKTFDQAPFKNSAQDSSVLASLNLNNLLALAPDVAANLKTELQARLDSNGYRVYDDATLVGLTSFLQLRQTDGGIPNSNLVTNINVQGEFLSSAPFTLYDRIGTTTADILNSSAGASGGDLHAQSLLTAFLQSKQTAGEGKALSNVTFKLPDLLKMIFDSNLFAHSTDTDKRNLLEHLVRHETGVQGLLGPDAMVTRFTTDLWKLAQDGGLTMTDGNSTNADLHELSNALIAFAMEKYYKEPLASVGVGETLFKDVSGGIQFDTAAVAETITAALGYSKYFAKYLLQEGFATDESALIQQKIAGMRDWYVQAGAGGMGATDGLNQGAFMLGGSGADNLTGGTAADLLEGNAGNDVLNGGDGNDVLLGGAGNDTLNGGIGADTMLGGAGDDTYTVDDTNDVVMDGKDKGKDLVKSSETYTLGDNLENLTLTGSLSINGTGNDQANVIKGNSAVNILTGGAGNDILMGNDGAGGDRLNGGAGFDTYYADEGDYIQDTDGKGTVFLNGKQLSLATRKKGETAYHDAAGNTYILSGSTLLVGDPLVIGSFSNGDLGIELKEEPDPDDPDDPALKKEFQKAEATTSPIVLDLDGNGIQSRGIGEGAFFDYDGNGFAERTGWVTPTDGLLVRDLNANGKIDSGTELFGDHTLLKNGQTATNGFAALADLDDNGDGKLDYRDTAWTELKVWQDANSDGITDAGELKSLTELGIQSIVTAFTTTPSADNHLNQHQQQGSFVKTDGSTGLAEDIWFRINKASTRQVNPLELPEDIRNMPEIKGMGNVASLRQVMAQDATGHLKGLIEQFIAEADPIARNTLTTQIIYAWAGVEDKDPNSRAATKIYGNVIGDARKLYAIEALLGEGYLGTWCWGEKDPNPHGPAARILLKTFDEFANGIAAKDGWPTGGAANDNGYDLERRVA